MRLSSAALPLRALPLRALRRPLVALLGGSLALTGLGLGLAPSATAAAPAGLPTINDGAVLTFAQMGTQIVVGGTFTTLTLPGGTVVTQPRLFAYDLATGTFNAGFRPVVNGEVDALVGSPDGSGVFVGGAFTMVNGTTGQRLVRVKADGSRDTAFDGTSDNRVQALSLLGSRLFVGGQFAKIRGKVRTGLAEVSAVTGKPTDAFNLALTGVAGTGGFTGVHALKVSPDGTKLLVAHTSMQLAGQERYGIAIVDISGPTATVDPWYTTLWKDNLVNSGGAVRVTDAAWGPSGTWFVTSNTGGDRVPTNDSVQRFDLSGPSPVSPTWVTRQFDSSYSIDVDPNGTVYVGGHFRYTEAQGSTDPYPGDPAVNYGWGPAGGARVLGTQVVYRQQIDALDPTTGKALNWWSSADGQHGVTALKVVGSKLLIGHDGMHVDGDSTGRHGMANLYGAPYDTSRGHSAITAPPVGANLEVGSVPILGTATAPNGVKKVQVEIKRVSDGTWQHTDGTFGSFYAFAATVNSPGATTTTWSLPATLANFGDYMLYVKTFDVAGADETVKQQVPVFMNDSTDSPPALSWTYPLSGQQDFTGNTVTVTGTATDPDGVAAVALSFRNVTFAGFVTADGSLGDFTSYAAVLANPGAVTTTWSYTIALPNGDYNAMAVPADTKGAADPRGVSRSFTMAPTNAPPTATISSPTTGTTAPASFTVTGTASDNTGVSRVLVRVADKRFGRGPQIAGTFGPASWRPATLTAPGSASTSWSIDVAGLPYGTYVIQAYAEDSAGVITPNAARPSVTSFVWPAGATAEPATTLTTSPDIRWPALAVSVAGSASYAPGVASVQLVVQNTVLGWYLQPDGSTGLQPAYLPASMASPGAASSGWTATVNVPVSGAYQVDAIAVGTDGNVDSTASGSQTTYRVYPGDADPTIELNSPVDGAIVTGTGNKILAAGRAFDDVGVRTVQLYVTNLAGTSGIKSDGTVGKPAWVTVFITNPGGTFTNWNYTTVALPSGTWKVSARAIDSVGKVQLTWPTSTITLAP